MPSYYTPDEDERDALRELADEHADERQTEISEDDDSE